MERDVMGKYEQDRSLVRLDDEDLIADFRRLPALPGRLIPRAGVSNRLREALACGVAVVCAPRGSGAKTAVRAYIAENNLNERSWWTDVSRLPALQRLGPSRNVHLIVVEDSEGTAGTDVASLVRAYGGSSETQFIFLTYDSSSYQLPSVSSEVDVSIVEPCSFDFTEEEVEELAMTFGLRLTPAARAQVTDSIGSWAEGLKVAFGSCAANHGPRIDQSSVETLVAEAWDWARELASELPNIDSSEQWALLAIPSFLDDRMMEVLVADARSVRSSLDRMVAIGMAVRDRYRAKPRWRFNPLLRAALTSRLDEITRRRVAGLVCDLLLKEDPSREAVRLAVTSKDMERILLATDRAFGVLNVADWLRLASTLPPSTLTRLPTLISLRGPVEERLSYRDRTNWRANRELPKPDPLELAGLAAELRAQGDLVGEAGILRPLKDAASRPESAGISATVVLQEISSLVSVGRFSEAIYRSEQVQLDSSAPAFRHFSLLALQSLSNASVGSTRSARQALAAALESDALHLYAEASNAIEILLAEAMVGLWGGDHYPAERYLTTLTEKHAAQQYQVLRAISRAFAHYLQMDFDHARTGLLKALALAEVASSDEARGIVSYLLEQVSLQTGEAFFTHIEDGAKGDSWITLSGAQYAFLRHDFREALERSSSALEGAAPDSFVTVAAELISSAAMLRLGRTDGAVESFGRGLSVANAGMMTMSLLAIPFGDLSRLVMLTDTDTQPVFLQAKELRSLSLGGEFKHGALTQREREVVNELATGDTLESIARRLFVSENTLRSHTRSVYRKLGVQSRQDAVSRAIQYGFVRIRSE